MIATNERLLTIRQVCERLHVHLKTVRRWSHSGVNGVKLETISIGRRRYTSEAAFARFVEALNPQSRSQQPGPAQGETLSRQRLRVEHGI